MSETMDPAAFAVLRELLSDAESCARLSQWEEGFLSDLRGRVLVYGERTRISRRQRETLNRIEQKVYAHG
jgi:hypothetical protein